MSNTEKLEHARKLITKLFTYIEKITPYTGHKRNCDRFDLGYHQAKCSCGFDETTLLNALLDEKAP